MLYFLILLKGLTTHSVAHTTDTLKRKEAIAYYQCFDLMHFKPMYPINGKRVLPFVKVMNDSIGIRHLEVYTTSARKPVKVYDRFFFNGHLAYAGTSEWFLCTTIDTLILMPGKLFELRDCYASKGINEQELLYYEIIGQDSISLKYMRLFSLYRDPDSVLHATTDINSFQIERNESNKEDYLITVKGNKMIVTCKTKNSPWCQNGLAEGETDIWCLYWSMIGRRTWNWQEK